jgi:exopolysaccharide production protein ExoQ
MRTFFRRLFYLLISLSVLLVKYYPWIGKQYDQWTGAQMFVGPTTSKNMLGAVCLIGGLFFLWDTVTRWPDRKKRIVKRIIGVNIAFLAMTLWLLNLSDSATSRVCFAIGCVLILILASKRFGRNPKFLKVLIPAGFCLYLILAFGFGISGDLAGAVGRDPTFTGRDNIWRAVLSTNTNPVLGAGYQSFWLGSRLVQVWELAGHVNEAHNGYLEVYLNLGLVGDLLLIALLVSTYVAICKRQSSSPSLSSFALAFWTIVLFYNMTESAAFSGHFLWVMFLTVMIAVPTRIPIAVRTSSLTTATKKTSRNTERGTAVARA